MSEIRVFVSNPKPGVFAIREPETNWDIVFNFNIATIIFLFKQIDILFACLADFCGSDIERDLQGDRLAAGDVSGL